MLQSETRAYWKSSPTNCQEISIGPWRVAAGIWDQALPTTVVQATDAYRSDQDPLDEFLTAHCVMEANASILSSDLYSDYKAWAETAGEKPKDAPWFGRLLTQRGIDLGRTGRQRFYLGIRLCGVRK